MDEKLRRSPSLIPTAVEEVVRWVSPVVQFCRTAAEDVENRGTKVRQGEACCIFYPSANRDEDVFPDPFTFRGDRTPQVTGDPSMAQRKPRRDAHAQRRDE